MGRTLLTCNVTKLEVTNVYPATLEDPKDGDTQPMRLLMTVQTTDPVSWTIRGFVEADDLREIFKAALKPAVLLTAFKFLLFGSKSTKSTAAPALKGAADCTADGQAGA